MKCKIYFIAILILLTSGKMKAGEISSFINAGSDTSLLKAEKWFSAWELVSKKIYKKLTLQPVEFIFFDTAHIYSTSSISIPNGELIGGPKIFNKTLPWKKALHHGKITLPNRQVVPIGLMSFASPGDSLNQTAFFVMPLPGFWAGAGVTSKELGLDHLVTGVFLHEFSHTQQMRNFGSSISAYEKKYTFKTDFSDDIIQDYFEKDSLYNMRFRNEVKVLYDAAGTKEKAIQKKLIKEGLTMLESRQRDYFTGDNAILKEIDDFFLTMEGIGQYSMYCWLIHPQGANLPEEVVLPGVRRGGRSWSQEEGLALFLILEKLSKPHNWARSMFGKETVSVKALIKMELNKK